MNPHTITHLTSPRPIRRLICHICGVQNIGPTIPAGWLVVEHCIPIACPDCSDRIYRSLLAAKNRLEQREDVE